MFKTTELAIQFLSCILVFVVWFYPVIIVRKSQKVDLKGFNANNPRSQYSSLPEHAVRALNAHNNTLEGFVFFAFALIANYIGKGSEFFGAVLAVIFAASRVGYTFFYINDLPKQRAICFSGSFFSTFALLVLPFIS